MNTIRELKQQEKYKSMLKRKNKEKKIYKDKNASLQLEKQRLYIALRNKDKEIEQLKSQLQQKENIIKGLDNTIENLEEVVEHKENIIKEVREYCNLHLKTAKEVIVESEKWLEVEEQTEFAKKDIHTAKVVKIKIKDILQILDKENK